MTVTADLRMRATEEGEGLVIALAGSLETETSPELAAHLQELDLAHHRRVILDLADLDRIDSTGVAVILDARDRMRTRHVDLRIRRASPKVKKVFALTLRHIDEQSIAQSSPNGDWISRIGQGTLRFEHQVIEAIKQLGDITYATVIGPFRGQRIRTASTAEQIVLFGFGAIPIIVLISFLIGLIMAMQAAHQLRDFGANIFVADLVGIATTRELGPFITAIVVAGRSGSAIAAELGTMVVTEEIDALRTMGLSPTRYLVVPRFLALTIAMPCLVIIADAVAILGGMVIAATTLDIGYHAYFKQTIDAIILSDLLTGLAKSLVFGIIIANVGVFEGFHVQGGAEGVGRATTRTVVISILLIIVADAIFTAYFHFL